MVLDEADLLLTGGYEKDTLRILKAFLEGDKQQRASAAAIKFGLTDDMLQRMPRQLRKAAQTGALSHSYLSLLLASIDSQLCLANANYTAAHDAPVALEGSDMYTPPRLSNLFLGVISDNPKVAGPLSCR